MNGTLHERFGIFTSRALWEFMTLAENVALPPEKVITRLAPVRFVKCFLKLSLVGLVRLRGFYPSEISGSMENEPGLPDHALDRTFSFFDEPSAGLDPISSKLR